MIAAPPTTSPEMSSGDLQTIQRIMNREFQTPQFNLCQSPISSLEAKTRRPSDPPGLSSSCEDPSLLSRSHSPVAVNSLRTAVNIAPSTSKKAVPSLPFRYEVFKSKTHRRNSTCEHDDTFDTENMNAPVTSLQMPLRYEFNRLSKSVAHPDYTLGQQAHPDDIICESSDAAATYAATLLRRFDAAFVKRKGDVWCYAMLIDAKMPENDRENWSLTFVVDEEGSTKTIFLKKWSKYIRLIRPLIELNAFTRRKIY